jgi:hypothetical protein
MAVTRFREDELYPSELHINQNLGAESFGLAKWVERDDKIENTDVVAWPCFGVSHISRAEDWPIMPVEILRVHLKPSNFFKVSLDNFSSCCQLTGSATRDLMFLARRMQSQETLPKRSVS